MSILANLTFRDVDPEKDLEYTYDLFKRTISPYVKALNGDVWPEAERRPFFIKGFSEPGMHMIECEGVAIGCYSITETQDSVILQRVYLEPEYQRCGIGRYLISQALERAHDVKKPLDLEVLENNTPAIASYEKGGFLKHHLAVNGWNRKWLMRHKDTDAYSATPVLPLKSVVTDPHKGFHPPTVA